MARNMIHHDFLTIHDLSIFMENVNEQVFDEKKTVDAPHAQLDTTRFEPHLVNPIELDTDVLYQLADLIDKKCQLDRPEVDQNSIKGPNSVDKILSSLAVAYITEEGIPVAVATLVDPTTENYKGIVPKDFYSLKASVNLENRIQQEYFVVADEYKGVGISDTIRTLLEGVAPAMFVVIDSADTDTIKGLIANGYKPIAKFTTSWDDFPVQLWFN